MILFLSGATPIDTVDEMKAAIRTGNGNLNNSVSILSFGIGNIYFYRMQNCLIGRVVIICDFGSGYLISIPRAGRKHVVFRGGLQTVGAALGHDAR